MDGKDGCQGRLGAPTVTISDILVREIIFLSMKSQGILKSGNHVNYTVAATITKFMDIKVIPSK